ncbi:PREDICTED: UDP-N-acetylglucosamine--dolichyl-phosphate N-acetylglucosaminephosphotransferase-like, partial [Amphimedon queenslandica]|uniref:UDP-N-acetylglucosamine--dolichyl-phosphate N-acetylglucosaminephosphotransferase n=2 Tax=Amphimedon queenslandica TaxID=400682 RepID=A0AAN0IIG7_AMPQE
KGVLVYIYMGMLAVFCTNAMNILAGVNGVETGQSVIIGTSIAVFNVIEIARDQFAAKHLFSLYLILPFIAVSLALLRHNWYPSKVFVGDTLCYFAGMTFAVVAILGSFSKTMLLFFIPQVFNFLYSVPQLFGIIPCPRHRLPKFDRATGLLGMSYAKFSPDQMGPGGAALLKTLSFLRLAKVEWSPPSGKEKKAEISVNNLTIINYLLKFIGPTHERTLTIYIMTVQVVGTIIAFSIRYGFVRFFYDVVQ